MKSKLLALVIVSAAAVGILTGCGGLSLGKADDGAVYYLNFKPEQDEAWQNLAALYTEKTGVPVTIITPESGTYETRLNDEIRGIDPPTLFQINGPVGLETWKKYCYDLSDSDVYDELISQKFVLKDGDAVAGIAYVIESYGIITNTGLLAEAGYSVEDIKSFADLKKIVEDITARKEELGFSAFCSAGMAPSSEWRFTTHLANLPIYFEYKADGIEHAEEIKGTYLDQYKNIWDLYINNATCAPAELAGKTGEDALSEFLNQQAVFYQNGSWIYNEVKKLGNDKLAMIPIYIGVGDENQGLCTGSENYWCVNKLAAQENIQATLDFLEWCVTSDKGVSAMENEMGFVLPFENAEGADNLFAQQDRAYTQAGKEPVSWSFTTMPSEAWKDDLGSALTDYAAQTGDWAGVVSAFVDGWSPDELDEAELQEESE